MIDVWDPAVREQISAGFAASGLAYASDVIVRVGQQLDAYAASWVAMSERQCRIVGDAMAAERAQCMARRRDQLASTTRVWRSLGAEHILDATAADIVARAGDAAARLPPVSDCMDDGYLSARIPPPDEPNARVRADALRPQIIGLRAAFHAGDYRSGSRPETH